ARIGGQRLQAGEVRAGHGVRVETEFGGEPPVAIDDPGDARGAVVALAGRLQRVGHARQRRHHHEHACAFRGTLVREPADGVPSLAPRHRRPAELEHDPAVAWCHRCRYQEPRRMRRLSATTGIPRILVERCPIPRGATCSSTCSPTAPGPAIPWAWSSTAPAWTTTPCRRSRAGRGCRKPRSYSRPATGTPVTACASSARGTRCRSPATPVSAPRTRCWRRALRSRATGCWCRRAPPACCRCGSG